MRTLTDHVVTVTLDDAGCLIGYRLSPHADTTLRSAPLASELALEFLRPEPLPGCRARSRYTPPAPYTE